MTSLELLACVALVSASAFLAASEIALFSLSRFQLRGLKERFRPAHKKIRKLLSDPGGLLITILVSSEVVNVALSTLVATAVARATGSFADSALASIGIHWPSWAVHTLVGTLITAPVVLFLCEITPKTLGARGNTLVAPLTASGLTFVYDAMKPVRIVLKRFVSGISRFIASEAASPPEEGDGKLLRKKEFLFMVEEGHKEGAIRESELELIKNVFDLDDTPVSDVSTPLSQVHSLPATTTVLDALSGMRGRRYSRIPVTDAANRRSVVGVLYTKDLLFSRLEPGAESRTIETLMRKPLAVGAAMHLNALFRRMKQFQTHLAIVQGASGDAIGIVTMDDVLDALFDELIPEEEE